MYPVFVTARARTLGCWLLIALLPGCGLSHKDYIPTKEKARKTLETALTAWQSGQPPGKIGSASPSVQVVDSGWKAGQKLSEFTILEEEPGDGPRWFSVRLRLENLKGELVVRYVVLGRDPIWVYREEDYKRATGM
jgi:hypothetical protein